MNLVATLVMLGLAALCLFGAWQKLRDKAAPRKLPGLRQYIMTPANDPVGFWLSIGLNFFLAAVFVMAALLSTFQ